jgi:hypothetical protein
MEVRDTDSYKVTTDPQPSSQQINAFSINRQIQVK